MDGGGGMSNELIIVVLVGLIWLLRLEFKSHNLKVGKHYELYDDNGFIYMGVMGIDKYGDLETTFYGPSKMTYSQAKSIKSKYPDLIMVNKQTEEEVAE